MPLQSGTAEEAGIYRVRWLRGGKAVHPDRFLGSDSLGILAIGQAKSLEVRRSLFVRAAESRRASHSEGKLLGHLVYFGVLPENTLGELHWEYRTCGAETLDREEEAEIKAYVLQFGQTPPLNCVIPNRHGEWPGILRLI